MTKHWFNSNTLTFKCNLLHMVINSEKFHTDQIDQPAQAVLLVKELQHRSEGEGNREKHGGVADARSVGRLQQPESVRHHIWQHAVCECAHLRTDTHKLKIKNKETTAQSHSSHCTLVCSLCLNLCFQIRVYIIYLFGCVPKSQYSTQPLPKIKF